MDRVSSSLISDTLENPKYLNFKYLGFSLFISVTRMSTKIVSMKFVNAVDDSLSDLIKCWGVK